MDVWSMSYKGNASEASSNVVNLVNVYFRVTCVNTI